MLLRLLLAVVLVSTVAASIQAQTSRDAGISSIADLDSAVHKVLSPTPQESREAVDWLRGVLNDTASIYFADATLASAFVSRWCVAAKVEIAGGVFQVREDEPEPRIGAGLHRRLERGSAVRQRPLKLLNFSLTDRGAAYLKTRHFDAICAGAPSDAHNGWYF